MAHELDFNQRACVLQRFTYRRLAPAGPVGRSRHDRARGPRRRAPVRLECPQDGATGPARADHHRRRCHHPAALTVPEQFATVRTNPITGASRLLGVVGSKYEPVQNEASCTLLDALIDESGAVYETAGALQGGRETFVTMKLPTSMTFDGQDGSKDRTDWYLAALNSHDGSSAFRFLVTPIRIVCANTQNAAIALRKPVSRFGTPAAARRDQRGPHRVGAELALHRGVRDRSRRALRRADGHRGGARLRRRARQGRRRPAQPPQPNRREQANGIVKLLSLARRSHPSAGPGGPPTTRSPSTSTTWPRSVAPAPRARPARRARCAQSPPATWRWRLRRHRRGGWWRTARLTEEQTKKGLRLVSQFAGE